MNRILVAVDGSECAKRAVDMAASMAVKFQAPLTVLSVFQSPVVPEPYAVSTGDLEASIRKYDEELARAAAEQARTKGAHSDWVVLSGSPAETIADYAANKEVDLVVVGCRGRGAVQRVLLGSVSSRLAHICTRPLLIVR